MRAPLEISFKISGEILLHYPQPKFALWARLLEISSHGSWWKSRYSLTSPSNGLSAKPHHVRTYLHTSAWSCYNSRITIDVLLTTVTASIESLCCRCGILCFIYSHHTTVDRSPVQSINTQILPPKQLCQPRNQWGSGSIRSIKHCYGKCAQCRDDAEWWTALGFRYFIAGGYKEEG